MTKKLTRRSILTAAAAAAVHHQAGAWPARFPAGGQVVAAPITAGMSRTFVNTGSSATPSDWGIEFMMLFPRGAVPAGSIAEPKVGGVVQNYNVSEMNFQHWDDNSYHFIKYYITRTASPLAAGASITFDFSDVHEGSWDFTTAVDETDFTSETDFVFRLSNVHTARLSPISQVSGKVIALTIDNSSGQISGAKATYPTNTTIPTANVIYGNGTGGQLSITSGVPTIVNPGSGFSFEGSGVYEAAFNDIIAAAESGGNFANGVAWEWVGRGKACDEIKGRIVLPLSHYHVWFYILRFKKANGSLLSYAFTMRGNLGLIDSDDLTDYTFDLDIFNRAASSTAIRGASVGYEPHQTICQYVFTGAHGFNENADYDWTDNSDARNAVQLVLTPDECLYFRKAFTHPFDTLDSTRSVPTTYFEWNHLGGDPDGGDTETSGIVSIGKYRPMGTFGLRNGFQQDGGDSNLFAGYPECLYYYWLACYHGRQSEALVYLNNVKVSAAHGASSGNAGGGALVEKTTTRLPNCYPASQYSFPGMAPTRENWWTQPPFMSILGRSNTRLFFSTGPNGVESINTPSHQYNVTFHPYLLLGREWIKDSAIFAGTCNVPALSYATKNVVLGGRTYRRCYLGDADVSTGPRAAAWYRYNLGLAARLIPEGTSERAHAEQILNDNYAHLNAIPSYIGSFTYFNKGTVSHPLDFSDSGVYPLQFYPDALDYCTSFMEDYEGRGDTVLRWLFQGTTVGGIIDDYVQYRRNFYVKRYTAPSHIYWADCRLGRTRVNITTETGGPVNFAAGINRSDPGNSYAIWLGPQPGGTDYLYLKMTAGSDVIQLTHTVDNLPRACYLWGTQELPSGTPIILTGSNEFRADNSAVIPTGFAEGPTFYYWLRLTSTTGKLCTDPELTNPMVAAEDHPTVTSPNIVPDVFAFYVPMIDPPDLSFGTHHNVTSPGGNSRVSAALGVMRQMKALALPGEDVSDLNTAISRLSAVWTALGSSYGPAIRLNMVDTL